MPDLTPEDAAVIESARALERPEALVVLGSSDVRLRIAAAWGSGGVLMIRPRDLTAPLPGDLTTALDAVWSRTTVCIAAVARTSGVTESQVQRCLPLLKANQIVYPDGTIHALVRRLLHERVLRQFGTPSSVGRASQPRSPRPER